MARRYDPELAVADRFKAYLVATLSEALRLKSPVVTFYDPQAQADAHRVVVFPQEFNTQTNDRTSWTGQVEITVKSQVSEKKMASDIAEHFDRTNEVREALLRTDLLEAINAGSVGLGLDYVSPSMKLSTDVRKGWIYSDISLAIACHARAAADDV